MLNAIKQEQKTAADIYKIDLTPTFLIGADGKIEHVWDPVTAKGHPAEVLAALSKK